MYVPRWIFAAMLCISSIAVFLFFGFFIGVSATIGNPLGWGRHPRNIWITELDRELPECDVERFVRRTMRAPKEPTNFDARIKQIARDIVAFKKAIGGDEVVRAIPVDDAGYIANDTGGIDYWAWKSCVE